MRVTVSSCLLSVALISAGFADEELSNVIGIVALQDSFFVEAAGGYQMISSDSIFTYLGNLERAFEQSRPFYAQYYYWWGNCGDADLESIESELRKIQILDLLFGCRDASKKKPFLKRVLGEGRVKSWEGGYMNRLDSISSGDFRRR